jgi:hypothetical protein
MSLWGCGWHVAVALAALVGLQAAWACEPCMKTLDLDESVERADLIIVGRRTDYFSREAEGPFGGPDTVRVKVLRVLKGPADVDEITVNSWDGMCDYGIVVDDREYVMLLEEQGPIYIAVLDGCGVKALLVERGGVELDAKHVSLDELAARFEPAGK